MHHRHSPEHTDGLSHATRKEQNYSTNRKGAVEESTRHALSLDVRWLTVSLRTVNPVQHTQSSCVTCLINRGERP